MGKSNIPYCTHTWNPVTGCTPVGAGCTYCWASEVANRFPQTHAGKRQALRGFTSGTSPVPACPTSEPVPFSRVTLHPERLSEPAHWRKPRVVLVCAMGDLFHPDVPDGFIGDVWDAMESAGVGHTHLVLTKRPEGMRAWWLRRHWRSKEGAHIDPLTPAYGDLRIWLGTSIWDQESADRAVPLLRATPAAHRWLSIEPLLGPIDRLDLTGIEQVIVGAESLGSRPGRECNGYWVKRVWEQCFDAGVRCYVKQEHIGGKLVKHEPGLGHLAWGERL